MIKGDKLPVLINSFLIGETLIEWRGSHIET